MTPRGIYLLAMKSDCFSAIREKGACTFLTPDARPKKYQGKLSGIFQKLIKYTIMMRHIRPEQFF
jgi:hypothetical protein